MILNRLSTKACLLQLTRKISAPGRNIAGSVAGCTSPQTSHKSRTPSCSSIFYLSASTLDFYPQRATLYGSARWINICDPSAKYFPLWGPTHPGTTRWSILTFFGASSSISTRKRTLLLPGYTPSLSTSSTLWAPPSAPEYPSINTSATSPGSNYSSSCAWENTTKAVPTPSITPSNSEISSSLWESYHTTLPPLLNNPSPKPTSSA